MSIVRRPLARGYDCLESCNGFRPQRRSPIDACFRPREVEPAILQIQCRAWQSGAIGVSEGAVDAEQCHGLQLRTSRFENLSNLTSYEHAGATLLLLPGPCLPLVRLGRTSELR